MNWEAILIASIPGFLALVGFIYNEYRKRQNAKEEADQTAAARREPTWNELVTENRNLREDVSNQSKEMTAFKSEFESKFDALERKMDRKIRAFENILKDIRNQWPADHEPPLFNSEDLTELLDANIPWKDRIRTMPGLA